MVVTFAVREEKAATDGVGPASPDPRSLPARNDGGHPCRRENRHSEEIGLIESIARRTARCQFAHHLP